MNISVTAECCSKLFMPTCSQILLYPLHLAGSMSSIVKVGAGNSNCVVNFVQINIDVLFIAIS